MAARLATVADLPPEFDGVDSRDLLYWLRIAGVRISVDLWGDEASEAHALLASHLLKKASKGSDPATGRGPVTSERVGDVAASYAASSREVKGPHSSTIYGQQYDEMVAALVTTPIAIRSDEEPYIHR